jgi:hypothetical protein
MTTVLISASRRTDSGWCPILITILCLAWTILFGRERSRAEEQDGCPRVPKLGVQPTLTLLHPSLVFQAIEQEESPYRISKHSYEVGPCFSACRDNTAYYMVCAGLVALCCCIGDGNVVKYGGISCCRISA